MNLKSLTELIHKSNHLSLERRSEIIKVLLDSTPYNEMERKSAVEALNVFQTINAAHEMSKIESLIRIENLIKTMLEISLNSKDYIDEILYFSTNKKITTIVLNRKVVLGVIETWKSKWHKENSKKNNL